MHVTDSPQKAGPTKFASLSSSKAAFSLVEVTMAIGIIAFAFVALFGLLPTGLTTFRAAIDSSNESWIMQNINSMVQTTDFAKVKELDFATSNEIYYFDEQGKLTDTENRQTTDEAVRLSRLYAVKLVTDRLERYNGNSVEPISHGMRVIAVLAPIVNANAMKDFDSVNSAASLRSLPAQTSVRTKTFVVARMDSE